MPSFPSPFIPSVRGDSTDYAMCQMLTGVVSRNVDAIAGAVPEGVVIRDASLVEAREPVVQLVAHSALSQTDNSRITLEVH